MGCTRDEFMSWIAAIAGRSARVAGNDVMIDPVGGGSVIICLDAKPPRTLGSMVLPVLWIDIRFSDVDAQARERFLAQFDLYTQRGGG